MADIVKLSRRDFVALSAVGGAGLAIGAYLPGQGNKSGAAALQPGAFVRIDPDDSITIWMARAEMGQGVRTSLPMVVADELDADWARVSIVQADAHPDKFGRQMTVGSSSVRGGAWTPLRQAGAAAREMLIAAAAARWSVPAESCRTERSFVFHAASGRRLRYGELAVAAAALPVPSRPRLKTPDQFRLIGTRVPQVDSADKVLGKAIFGIDVRPPNLKFAAVVHCPVFGGRLGGVDPAPARAVSGVREVVEIPSGVAVVADHTWAAIQGARALEPQWNTGTFRMSSAGLSAELARLVSTEGAVAEQTGDTGAALAGAAVRVEGTYEAPLLSHATMEPMNCTADVRPDRCEIWAPTQNPQGTQSAAARLTGLPVERVTVHVTYLGCGWGRRSRTDFIEDAVAVAKQVGGPVQVLWTREEYLQHDFYRPAAVCRFEGALDREGSVTAVIARVASTPIGGQARGVDRNGVDGIVRSPYWFAGLRVESHPVGLPVSIGHWRSVGVSQNTFFLESFLDELAHAGRRDPVELRRELLRANPRALRVLDLAAEKSGWGTPLPAGRARGIAIVENKDSVVAEVAEVSIRGDSVRVHRVVAAADCGQIIHPGIVEAQIAGSVVGGLSAAFHEEITLEAGAVKQRNFHEYALLRLPDAPAVEVHIVPSTGAPGSVGEPGLPPAAPAVANAVFALTGKRLRRLPLRLDA
jgi:CO/xanthine dehydrogenase Mo-binding subunit